MNSITGNIPLRLLTVDRRTDLNLHIFEEQKDIDVDIHQANMGCNTAGWQLRG